MEVLTARTRRSLAKSAVLRHVTIDHWWILVVLALAWLFISVLPLPPNDLWWHMAAGRTMVQEGAWLTTNRWAYTVPYDAPYIYQSWLSEVLLYGIWRMGDVPLLTLTRTAVIGASYGLIAWHAWRRSQSGRAVGLALILAVLIGWNNWTLRPQTLALLPGAAFILVLDGFVNRLWSTRWLFALPLLMAVWVNLHGSFILGVGLLGLAWIGLIITVIRDSQRTGSDSWGCLRACTLTLVGTLAATTIHPLGLGVFNYVRGMLTNTPSQKYIVEWHPPTNEISIVNTGFWFFATLLLILVLLAMGRRRASITDVLWCCGMAWLTIGGARYAMWFALALTPFLAEQLSTLMPVRRMVPASTWFNRFMTLMLAGMIVVTLPWFAPGRYLGKDADQLFAASGRYRMLLGNTTPVAATEWLARNPIDGHFWTDMSYSSYTIWELPEKQVFADLRVDLFPEAIWLDYFAIAKGDAISLAVIDRWQITHLLLDLNHQGALHRSLLDHPDWCEPYRDVQSAVLARCSTLN